MESRERKSVRVTIYNQPYTLGVSGEPGEVEALAQTVDDLMSGIAQRAGNVDAMKVAVLACLELADRARGLEEAIASLETTQQELTALKAHVSAKSHEFSLLLDEALK
jgi:cell division protein ZapA (FtsZ GTPase activity inhibitor)